MIISLLCALLDIMINGEIDINGGFMLLETICWCMIAITIKFVWFA